MSDAEGAVVAFLRFRDEVTHAGLRMDTPTIIQLMIAERLNVIAGNIADAQDRLSEIVNRMPGY
jgi:pheromone shutdown protein TraB